VQGLTPCQTLSLVGCSPHGSPGDTWTSTYNHFLTASNAAAGHVSDDLTVTGVDSLSHTQSVMAHWNQIFPV
jgi:hypothetical protein